MYGCTDLQSLCKMLNETKTSSFILKNVKVLKAAKKTDDLFADKKIEGYICIHLGGGVKIEYDFEAQDFDIGGMIK